MNPWDLSSSDLLVWGIVAHLIADWPLQNDWMAQNKMKRRIRHNPVSMTGELGSPYTVWWDRHLAAWIHAWIHAFALGLVFGWIPAVFLGTIHLIIDTRVPIVWWSKKVIKQTQPKNALIHSEDGATLALVDVGLEVRFWTDQVFHIACVAIAALLITL